MEAAAIQSGIMVELISALGPMGFVMWMVYRMTNTTIPRLAQDFKEAVDSHREDYKRIHDNDREFYKEQLDALRNDNRILSERLYKNSSSSGKDLDEQLFGRGV